jgi:hypothetical protein
MTEIEEKIITLRGRKVLLDFELANLYGVSTKSLVQAVKRNIIRFPADFMFQLNDSEFMYLRSQFVTAKLEKRRYAPYAFTELGVAMLSSVLNSTIAIQINIAIMRVFVIIREKESNLTMLLDKVIELKRNQDAQQNQINDIYEVIDKLLTPTLKRQLIGF